MSAMTRFLKLLGHAVFVLVLAAGTAWGATALWVQLAGGVRIALLVTLGLAAIGTLTLRFARSRTAGWVALIVGALGVGGWYQTIPARQDRDWAVDVSRGVTARVQGDMVTLANLRDFAWTSASDATPRWTTRQCDLTKLDTLDMITSVWSDPDIAHLLVSFGFADCGQVVFSVEIRREKGEEFNELGGFFRQFEQVLIAATEEDIVKLRTNFRHEEVRLYPVHLTAEQRRTMFLSYVALAQSLEDRPAFYNTLTANCTTTVWGLAKSLKPDLPVDRRLILSGHLPDYLTDLGVIDAAPAAMRDDAAKITTLAQLDDGTAQFSDLIRRR
jgi:hypothetical protein